MDEGACGLRGSPRRWLGGREVSFGRGGGCVPWTIRRLRPVRSKLAGALSLRLHCPLSYLSARVVGGGAALGRARKEGSAASPRTDGTVVEGAAEEGAAEEGAADDMAHHGHAACGNRALVDGAAEEGCYFPFCEFKFGQFLFLFSFDKITERYS